MRSWILVALVSASSCAGTVVDERRGNGNGASSGEASAGGSDAEAAGGEGGAPGGEASSTTGAIASGGSWVPVTGLTSCSGHSATRLADGSVLVVGDCSPGAGAGRVDPVSHAFVAVPSPTARVDHTATLLASGQVLVSGGVDVASGAAAARSWIFALDVGFAEAGASGATRFGHAAARLADGQVLLTGGRLGEPGASWTGEGVTASGERRSPDGDSLGALAPMLEARAGHVLAAVGEEVVAIGGQGPVEDLATVERFDGTAWTAAPRLPQALGRPAAIPLSGGRVFVAGIERAFVLDDGAWVETAAPVAALQLGAAIAPLDDGRILVVSFTPYGWDCSVQRYDPARDAWDLATSGPIACGGATVTATAMNDGSVLVVSHEGAAFYRP